MKLRIRLPQLAGAALVLMAALAVSVPASALPLPSFNRPVPRPWWPKPKATPEVDPNALRAALVILSGGVLVLNDRRRRR